MDSNKDDYNDYLCTICKNLLIAPRIYDGCGHTICEECMIKNDEMDKQNNRSVFDAVIYKCPLCRSTTITPWYRRPFNHYLIEILEKDKSYYEMNKKTTIDREKELLLLNNINTTDLHNVNLSKKVMEERELKADKLYNYIIPIIYEATLESKSYIIIKDKAKELRTVCDLVSDRLINDNKVYRITSTNTEFSVEIIPSKQVFKYNFTNEHFNENLENNEVEEDIEDVEIRYDTYRQNRTFNSNIVIPEIDYVENVIT